ncbi:S-adenosyl-L-methionine-dependent methyltransferases superfamily protein [Artemisia annua]|uniref:S-adenosyl-L-methionine-dependent methyltransferases superfamily protein n=1 Tax=Artemisia annua TaxID=35608 RepID=A0A2U1Q574_ARTAN|nr:S-adenosyl-L-methionine-dependent methyltransferases superfamily protein [Artemisia annua]
MKVDEVFHMNGGNGEYSYAQNSSLQKKTSDMTKHITVKCLEKTYASMTPTSLGIADLGCASGQNTLSSIREMVEAIDETSSKLSNTAPPEYRVYLNDLYTNDFNSLFKNLPDFYDELKNKRHMRRHGFDSSIYIAAYPGTFYGRLFPDKCLHFVYSFSSLHWLSRVPSELYDKQGNSINKGSVSITKTSPAEASIAYSNQFQKDFSLFLHSRSKELLSEGRMVLMLLGRRNQSHVDRGNSLLWELLSQSFALLVAQGEIEQEKFDEYDTHFYAPSKNELEEEIKKEGSFVIDHFEIFETELKHKACVSYGTIVAKTTRAIQESMISNHFGERILDNLFENYGRMIDEELVKEDIKPVSFIIVLKKI